MQIPGSDAAVLRIKGTPRGIAFVNDCNGRHCYLDPYRGAKAAVAEAARNLSCAGALPVAVTDCLNFGNPEKGDIYWTFEQAVEGMSQACEALRHAGRVGQRELLQRELRQRHLPDARWSACWASSTTSAKHCDARFKDEGDVVALLGPTDNALLDGSEYQKVHFGRVEGRVPDVDLDLEKELQRVLREGIGAGLVKSAHDCAEGGLAVALAECCIASGVEGGALTAAAPPSLGAALTLPSGDAARRRRAVRRRPHPRRSSPVRRPTPPRSPLSPAPCRSTPLGTVTGQRLQITAAGDTIVDVPVTELRRSYESLPDRLV